MPNANPKPFPREVQFKPQWQTGTTKRVSLPAEILPDCLAIARCIDKDPSIAEKVLQYAKSLVEQPK